MAVRALLSNLKYMLRLLLNFSNELCIKSRALLRVILSNLTIGMIFEKN